MNATKQKGRFAELQVEMVAAAKNWVVSRPTLDAPYDLILDDGKSLFRVQVKYAGGMVSHGSVKVCRNNGPCSPVKFEKDEIDAVLVYVAILGKVIWINADKFDQKCGLHIRVEPAKNGQRKGSVFAVEHVWE